MTNDSEHVRRVCFEQHPDPMWVFDVSTLRFLDVNDAAIRRYGWTRAEFLAMTIADIRPPEDVERLRASVRAFKGGRDEAGVWRHRCKSGEIIHVDIVSHTIEFDGRHAELVSARDVSNVMELSARLEEANELLRFAHSVAKVGAWSVALPHGPVTWSAETAAIHELPDVRTMPLERGIRFYAPEFRERIRAVFSRCVVEGVPYDEVMQLVTARGRRIWVRTIGAAVRDSSGAIVAARGAFQDVSELIGAREREAAASARLAATLEDISDGFITFDRAWRITYVNGRAARLLGRPRERLLGLNVWAEFPHTAGSVFQREYARCVARAEPAKFSAQLPGSEHWFDVSAYPIPDGLAVYFRDVTARRAADEALRLGEERFRLVARATNDVVWDWDLRSDTLWWSDLVRDVFGHDPGDPRLTSWRANVHADDRERVETGLRQVIDGGGTHWAGEYRFHRADGRIANVLDRGYVIRAADGVAVRMVGCMTDVTERRELDAQLRQSQKLEAVGQLTGGVAHDFNNLLTVILGSAEMLSHQLDSRPDVRRLAETIVLAAGRGADLTRRLLAFARRQALDPRVLDVGQLVADMDPLLRRVLAENVDVRIARVRGLWHVAVDPGQVEVALLNLAINARDAMPDGGRIAIDCANVVVGDERTRGRGDAPPGEYVVVSVADTGIGMTPDVLERAFEPFFTTKDVGKGSGLGLSMVYGFVKQSGGFVRIDSVAGRGTTVSLHFPRAATPPAATADATAPLEPRGAGEHVLVVEDEPLVREHATAVLRDLGYRVTAASNGTQALALLATAPDVALLFTDVVMPGGMNGPQLAAAARELRPGLRVLYTSGYAEDVLGATAHAERGVPLVAKPYPRAALAAKLRAALAGRP